MILEEIFLRETAESELNTPEITRNSNAWHRTEQFGWASSDIPAFEKSGIFLAGMQFDENGRLLNPEDLLDIHELSDQFTTYKYSRAKFIQSKVY